MYPLQRVINTSLAKMLRVGLAVAQLALVSGCSRAPNDDMAVRLQWLDQAQFAGFYAAKENGIFDAHGLKVDLKSGGPDFSAMAMVVSGSDFAGMTTGDQILIARSKGFPVKAIFVDFKQSPVCFMVRRDSGIRSPRDFVGRTVGMKYGYNTETEYVALLDKAGLHRDQMKETAVKFDLQRFFTGEVDIWAAFTINEPLAAARHNVDVDLIRPVDYGVRSYSDVLFVHERAIANRRADIERLCAATRAGWTWALKNKDAAVDLVLKYNPTGDREHERRMLDATELLVLGGAPANDASAYERIGVGNRQVWEEMLNVLTKQGQIEQPIRIDDAVSDVCGLEG